MPKNKKNNPHRVVEDFEEALAEYTRARYVVCVNSCTMALLLAVKWCLSGKVGKVEIPKRTYMSVPMSIIHAGGWPTFRDENWRGAYQLKPLPVWDCARRFTGGMYVERQFQCVSFSANKILGIEQGGAILHDSDLADSWFRRMRFDGRRGEISPDEDRFLLGYHCFMLPSIAAQGILRLHHLPENNEDMGAYEYPDLSVQEVFQ